MANENFTAQQWIEYFFKKLEKGETVTVNDLREAVKTISVHDSVAASDALTVFYSGEGSSFPKGLSETAGGEIRMIASETSGDAYALVSNALSDRIFATDELKTLLETLPDGAIICGFDAARGVVSAA